MTTVQAPSELNWDPPGPGSWHIDPVHHPRPVTRYWVEMHPEPFGRGTREFMSFYGLLLEQLEVAYVNGFAYHATRVVPDEEVPSRFARAEEVFAREALARAAPGVGRGPASRPRSATHRELQSVDPDALSDEDLVGLPRPLPRPPRRDDLPAHALHGRGDDLDRRPPRPRRRLDRAPAREAARHDARRRADLGRRVRRARAPRHDRAPGPGGAGAARVRRRPGEGPRRAPFARHRRRPRVSTTTSTSSGTGCSTASTSRGRTALEMPDALLRAIRSSVAGRAPAVRDVEDQIADVRRQVPDEHRAEFDELLDEARLTYRHPRRARRLQRHLGVGHHATRRARGGSPGSDQPAGSTTPSTSSTPGSTRCAR